MVKSYEKYDNLLPYPKLKKQQHPEPKRKDFVNYTEHGIAMDQWERDCRVYDIDRKKLIKQYQDEQSRMITLFFDDLMDELNWDVLPKEKIDKLKSHIWEEGHSSGFPECYNVAYNMAELVDVLIKDESKMEG